MTALTRAADGALYVAEQVDDDTGSSRVRRVLPDGSSSIVVGGGGLDPFEAPTAQSVRLGEVKHLAVDAAGTVFLVGVGAGGQDVIYAATATGSFRGVAGFGADLPGGAARTTRVGNVGSLSIDASTGRLLVPSHDVGVLTLSADGHTFERLTSYGAYHVQRSTGGSLLLSSDGGIGRVLPDGGYVHLVGYRSGEQQLWGDGRSAVRTDLDGGIGSFFEGPGAALTFHQGSWYASTIRVAHPATTAPVFRAPEPLSLTAVRVSDSVTDITISTERPSEGDQLIVVRSVGPGGVDSPADGELVVDEGYGVPWDPTSSSTLTRTRYRLPAGEAHSFTVFRRTSAHVTSAGVTTTVAPGASGTAPGRATGVTATPAVGAVDVSWTAPASAGQPTGYTVTNVTDGRAVQVDGAARSARVAGLTNGASYAFTVTATNGAGTGPATAPVSATPNGCAPTRFSDVAADHPFCSQIAWMVGKGITTGTNLPDGSVEYRPAVAVSRQAMAPFLYRAAGSPTFTAPAVPSFADVPTSHAFFHEIEWMRAKGISTGTEQSTGKPLYKPLDPVSRLAMAPFLYRAAGSPDFAAPATTSFADVPTGHPFFREIEWMRASGVSTGTAQSNGSPLYKPVDAVSRQAMAAFLNRSTALAD